MRELLDISQRSGFDEMMRDLAGVFVHSAGINPLGRLCDPQVPALAAWEGEAREQGLPHELVGKVKSASGPSALGTISPMRCASSRAINRSSAFSCSKSHSSTGKLKLRPITAAAPSTCRAFSLSWSSRRPSTKLTLSGTSTSSTVRCARNCPVASRFPVLH